jgi:tetratricopeptide (TPR) repeat protein
VSELLNSYYRLAATVQRDNGNFEAAYVFANEGVRLAKAMGSDTYTLQIVAASQYTRGVVNFAWGVFGDNVKQGKTMLQSEKIKAALLDFDRALVHATPQLKGIIYSEMARAKALLSTSPIDVTISLKLIEQAEHFIDIDSHDNFYTQILLNGDLKGLDKRRLILGRAKTFLAIKRPEKTLEELDELEELDDGLSHTRRRAWTHILYAQASFDLGDYATTANEAISAFNDCKAAHSLTHLARVNELHAQLLNSPYRDATDVKRLGHLLSTNTSKE